MSRLEQHLADFRIPRLMGILNITRDSFSDGGQFLDPADALSHAARLVADGADIIDVGGESTRPGSLPVPEQIELDRVIPVVERIRKELGDVCISVDTRKAGVAREAISHGAKIINDISALRYDPALAEVLQQNPEVGLILMHMQGEPDTMQNAPHYDDLLQEISDFFAARVAFAENQGIARERLRLDPGLGFGKSAEHNFRLLANLNRFDPFGLSLVIGASRKRFIAAINPSTAEERLGGSLAAGWIAALQNVEILRVHDVKAHRQFFDVIRSLRGETA